MDTVTLTIDGRTIAAEKRKTVLQAAIERGAPKGAGRPVLVALDERGRTLGSRDFAAKLKGWEEQGAPEILFLLGGADGLSLPKDYVAVKFYTGPALPEPWDFRTLSWKLAGRVPPPLAREASGPRNIPGEPNPSSGSWGFRR